jgi:hypothetical protein
MGLAGLASIPSSVHEAAAPRLHFALAICDAAAAAPNHGHWIDTMLRCASAFILAGALAFTVPVSAQVQRNFTAKALRGELAVGAPPEVTLNGKPARLAPGVRIYGENNLLQMSATLSGQKMVVNYTLDLEGLILEVWILDARERARAPWPTTLQEAQAWAFNPEAQAWTKR